MPAKNIIRKVYTKRDIKEKIMQVHGIRNFGDPKSKINNVNNKQKYITETKCQNAGDMITFGKSFHEWIRAFENLRSSLKVIKEASAELIKDDTPCEKNIIARGTQKAINYVKDLIEENNGVAIRGRYGWRKTIVAEKLEDGNIQFTLTSPSKKNRRQNNIMVVKTKGEKEFDIARVDLNGLSQKAEFGNISSTMVFNDGFLTVLYRAFDASNAFASSAKV
jgi:hypothetical protein